MGDIWACLAGLGPNVKEIVVWPDSDLFKKVRTQLFLLPSWPTITLELLPVSMPTNWSC